MSSVLEMWEGFVRATEAAAIAASSWRGKGDGKAADGAAVEAMRSALNGLPMDGRIAIGEGERDEAPMLWIGEELGAFVGKESAFGVDIAVDPLECTNNCALNRPNSIAVLAAAPRDTLLHAPDTYMDKLASSSLLRGEVSLDASPSANVESAADVLNVPMHEVRVTVLNRPRHSDLIGELRDCGVSLTLIDDGDISAAIEAVRGDETDLLLGIGAAPEGVISAVASIALDGVFEGRLTFRDDADRERASSMLPDVDLGKVWDKNDLCTGDDAIFVATGVCEGYLPGVSSSDEGYMTHSEVLATADGSERHLSTFHPRV
ncbi:MAG: fructose-bisphosphatase class II [Euryarchaeota archaeon]|nr:fructose-bisphosphatase class II [Euryarchaeota archaeon]